MKQLLKPALLIPITWWALAFGLAMLAAAASQCTAGWSEACWSRWDSGLYIDIARNGHTLFPCPDQPGKWCGNAGWAPLYPMLMALLHYTGMSLARAGMVLSELFFLGLLLVNARLWRISDFGWRSWAGMALVAFAPGSIYYHAIFPVSMVVFFLSLCMLFIRQERWFAAGLAAMPAVLSHSIGFFLLPALGVLLLLLWRRDKQLPLFHGVKLCGPPLLGLAMWYGYDWLKTGHWNAVFMIQEKYGHGLNSPLKMLGHRMDKWLNDTSGLARWIELQNMMLLGLVISICAWLWFGKKDLFARFQAAWLLFFWFLPYSASLDVALYRNCANLAPGWSAARNWPAAALLLLLAVFFILWWPMARLFMLSQLV